MRSPVTVDGELEKRECCYQVARVYGWWDLAPKEVLNVYCKEAFEARKREIKLDGLVDREESSQSAIYLAKKKGVAA